MRDTKADAETEMKRRTFPVYTEKVLDLRYWEAFLLHVNFFYLASVRLEHYIHLKVFIMTHFWVNWGIFLS